MLPPVARKNQQCIWSKGTEFQMKQVFFFFHWEEESVTPQSASYNFRRDTKYLKDDETTARNQTAQKGVLQEMQRFLWKYIWYPSTLNTHPPSTSVAQQNLPSPIPLRCVSLE